AVHSAELLPEPVPEPLLEDVGEREQRGAFTYGRVGAPEEDERDRALRLLPLAHHARYHAIGRPDPRVVPLMLLPGRREARQIALHERLDRVGLERTDDHERESGDVAEALSHERQ